MTYNNGTWANKNAVKAYDKYVKLSTGGWKTKRQMDRAFNRLFKKTK